MTNTEWNEAIEWATNAREEGDWVENENRKVEIVRMCGGQFLCYEDEEVAGLVQTPCEAVWFLLSGKIL